MGGNEVCRRATDRIGGGDQIGFVLRQKFQHGGQYGGKLATLRQSFAQQIGRQSGQRQQPLRALVVRQHPAQRGQSERLRIGGGFGAGANDWQIPVAAIGALTLNDARAIGASMTNRILVVEDNDLNRKLFCAVLTANGHTVEPVADGAKVLAAARAISPDLVVMDIQLPGVSGLELIAQIRGDAALANTPVLAVTAYAGKGDEEQIRAGGANGYLSKPVSIQPFMAAVNALLPDGGDAAPT